MKFPQEIQTERLILRRWRHDDRDAFVRIWADVDVWALLRPSAPFDPSHAPARFIHHLHHWEEHGFGLMAAQERASAKIPGWIGPAYPSFAPEVAYEVELAWTLRKRFWNRGLASEGAAAVASATLAHLDVDHLISLIKASNTRSRRVAEKLGMERSGRTVRSFDGDERLRVYVLESGRV